MCLQRLEIFSEMSDAHETTICSFTGITRISEKISRCCLIAHKKGEILFPSRKQVRVMNTPLHPTFI